MSHFQNLPHLISSQIFKYFLNNRVQDFPHALPDDIKPFGLLLWSCHNWRNIAICHLFEKQEINIWKKSISADACNWPEDLDLPLPLVSGLVKTLVLNIRLPDNFYFEGVYQDGVLENLPPSMIYSNAQLIEAHIKVTSFYPKTYTEDIHIQKTLKILLKYLKYAVPNVCDLEIHSTVSPFMKFGNYFKHIALAVRSLVASVAKRKIGIYKDLDRYPVDLGDICYGWPLTHICIIEREYNWEVELVRRCAESLQVLDINEMLSGANCSNIIKDGNGNHVVYPNLKQLVIRKGFSDPIDVLNLSFPNVVPFPNLQKFKCPDGYLFGDDVVFRGNQDALRDIYIYMDPAAAKRTIRNNVFSATSHPNLQRVKVCLNISKEQKYECEALAKLMYKIGKNAWDLTLDIVHDCYIQPDVFTPSMMLRQQQLQRLRFNRYKLSFSDIILLLNSLPNLVEFTTNFKPMKDYQREQIRSQAQGLIDEHYPLGPRLRKLGVLISRVRTAEDYVLMPLVILTLLCPTIVRVQAGLGVEGFRLQMLMIAELHRLGFSGSVSRFKELDVVGVDDCVLYRWEG